MRTERPAPADDAAAPGVSLPASPGADALSDDPVRARIAQALRMAPLLRFVGAALRPATVFPFCLLAAALVPVTFVTNGPSLCPFKVLTGLPCPGCGMTRSVVTLLHGDLSASLYYHPLGVMLVAVCIGLAMADGWIWTRESMGSRRTPSSWLLDRIMITPAPWIAIGALTVVWLVRLPLYVAGIWVF